MSNQQEELPDEDDDLTGPGVPIPPPADLLLRETKLRSLSDLSDEAFRVMSRRASGAETPVLTPWPSVNARLGGGLWPGFYVLVSSTGVGKTQWALQVALAAAEGELEAATEAARIANQRPSPRPIVYIALELGPVDLVARAVALLEAKHPDPDRNRRLMWSDLAFGKEDPAHLFERHREALRSLPFQVEVAPPHGWESDELATIAQLNPRVVIIDFLQLIAKRRHEDTREAMGRAAYQARALARDQGCIVLALSSTARINYGLANGEEDKGERTKPKDPGPGKGDAGRFVGLGKESGDIEFAADGVLALINEARAEGARTDEARRSHLAIAKWRGGGASWAELSFDGLLFSEPPGAAPRTTKGSI